MSNASISLAVVDDDVSVRKALTRLLSASSFRISTYGSAQDFIKSLKSELPECLVVDLQMPGIGGLELQRHLIRVGIRIPTIVITGHNEVGLRERSYAVGAVSFLVKPFDGLALIDAINDAVRVKS